jgi:hypothetical protein
MYLLLFIDMQIIVDDYYKIKEIQYNNLATKLDIYIFRYQLVVQICSNYNIDIKQCFITCFFFKRGICFTFVKS